MRKIEVVTSGDSVRRMVRTDCRYRVAIVSILSGR